MSYVVLKLYFKREPHRKKYIMRPLGIFHPTVKIMVNVFRVCLYYHGIVT